jgi:hypothetical protein
VIVVVRGQSKTKRASPRRSSTAYFAIRTNEQVARTSISPCFGLANRTGSPAGIVDFRHSGRAGAERNTPIFVASRRLTSSHAFDTHAYDI